MPHGSPQAPMLSDAQLERRRDRHEDAMGITTYTALDGDSSQVAIPHPCMLSIIFKLVDT